MPHAALSREQARRFYDRVGRLHDWAELYEGRAKARAMDMMDLRPGLRVLNVGVGTGKDHAAIAAALGGAELTVGLDVSLVMLHLVRSRTAAPAVCADIRQLPFADGSFDRVFCAYVLDLVAETDLLTALYELKRVLRADGTAVVVSLTEGVTGLGRFVVDAWRRLYGISPQLVGGCRPLHLSPLMSAAGFDVVADEVVEQRALPSEIVAARSI